VGEFLDISPGTGTGSPPFNANAGIAIGKMAKDIRYDRRRLRRSNGIEIMCGRLKDGRRIATRYDRCAKTFLSAVALAATALFPL